MRRIPLSMAAMKAIDELYASLPKIACKRLCVESCGLIEMTPFEMQRIRNRIGREPQSIDTKTMICPMLKKGDCKVHDIRPMLCRLWGLVDDPLMKCGFGCVPERWLSREEGFEMLNKIRELG